ncbi:MAG: 30S ribosomal protein S20 [Bdellovibrionaceae bacterium]|nr:30S ribosomal protein S20 [Pseudobdellovibrionaceae bacterium]
MANHKSSEKRARQTIKRAARNSQARKGVKTVEKTLTTAIAAKSKDVEQALRDFTAKIMASVNKGVIKKETASRKISRISKRISKMAAEATK